MAMILAYGSRSRAKADRLPLPSLVELGTDPYQPIHRGFTTFQSDSNFCSMYGIFVQKGQTLNINYAKYS